MALTLVVALTCCYSVLNAVSTSPVKVTTNVGTFLGTLDTNVVFGDETGSVRRFFGIPYAKPPVGKLRFERPEPAETLTSEYNATYHRPHCIQSDRTHKYIKYFQTDEDCLYLNIYTPNSGTDGTKYPVMIWIYGGSFENGGADIFDASVLSSMNDVVVVTFNYRVNAFGFLSNGDKYSGNYGLWDQQLAIKWVHANIDKFSGDPGLITVFGESAGAASAIYQSLNPENKGLFQRVIAQSGSVLAPWAIQRDPKATFTDFASNFCQRDSDEDTVECLRGISSEHLLAGTDGLSFGPTVDGDFIIDDPRVTVMNGTLSAVAALDTFVSFDFLSGVNSKDGAVIISRTYESFLERARINLANGLPRYIFKDMFIPQMMGQLKLGRQSLIAAALHEYTDWSNPNDPISNRDNGIDFLSDVYFFVPAIEIADLHDEASQKTTYFYEFHHRPALIQKPSWLDGANHAMEIPYVFGLPDIMKIAVDIPIDVKITIPPVEIALSTTVMKSWANFARTGDPSASQTWPAYDVTNRGYMHITPNITSSSEKSQFAASRVDFWTSLVPKIKSATDCPDNPSDDVNVTNAGHSFRWCFSFELFFMSLVILVFRN